MEATPFINGGLWIQGQVCGASSPHQCEWKGFLWKDNSVPVQSVPGAEG